MVVRIVLISLILISANITSIYCEDLTVKPTTIAGFINTGSASDNNFNIVIIKSLLSSFSQLPDTKVTTYEDVSKKAVSFWQLKKINMDQAMEIAQFFDSKQLIVGDYTVNKDKTRIIINVFVYDVVTGEQKMKRTYESTGNTGIFNTIDNMTKNLSGLLAGKELEMGMVMIKFAGIHKSYDVFMNSKLSAQISNETVFQIQRFAKDPLEISIRYSGNGKEVFRKQTTLNKDEIQSFDFVPSGTLIIKNMLEDGRIFQNEKEFGLVGMDKEISISIPAEINHEIDLKNQNGLISSTNISVNEGEEKVLVLMQKSQKKIDASLIDYKGKQALWNLLLPGLVQYQANDPWMGTLFLTGELAGIGMTTFSLFGLSLAVKLNNENTDPSQTSKLSGWVSDWTWMLCGSIAGWLTITGLSVFHAGMQTNPMMTGQFPIEYSFYCSDHSSGILLNYYF